MSPLYGLIIDTYNTSCQYDSGALIPIQQGIWSCITPSYNLGYFTVSLDFSTVMLVSSLLPYLQSHCFPSGKGPEISPSFQQCRQVLWTSRFLGSQWNPTWLREGGERYVGLQGNYRQDQYVLRKKGFEMLQKDMDSLIPLQDHHTLSDFFFPHSCSDLHRPFAYYFSPSRVS